MKTIFSALVTIFLVFPIFGQVVLDESKPFEMPSSPINTPPLDPFSLDNAPKIDLLTPKEKDFNLKKDTPKSIGFGEKSKFANPGKKYQDKLNERKGIDLAVFRRDQYLGDISIKSKRVSVLCRDYQYVDGDRIRISVNERIVAPNLILVGSYTAIHFDLEIGFNKIDFEALNMGESPPNTAELIIYDDKNKMIADHQWSIATGFKASFIVIREE